MDKKSEKETATMNAVYKEPISKCMAHKIKNKAIPRVYLEL